MRQSGQVCTSGPVFHASAFRLIYDNQAGEALVNGRKREHGGHGAPLRRVPSVRAPRSPVSPVLAGAQSAWLSANSGLCFPAAGRLLPGHDAREERHEKGRRRAVVTCRARSSSVASASRVASSRSGRAISSASSRPRPAPPLVSALLRNVARFRVVGHDGVTEYKRGQRRGDRPCGMAAWKNAPPAPRS
jgi:hypothetical protein